jgi:queuine tRNA-ribosyltransferase accessory subunit
VGIKYQIKQRDMSYERANWPFLTTCNTHFVLNAIFSQHAGIKMASQAGVKDESNMLSFSVTDASSRSLARLGRLIAPRRRILETPTFMAFASRGVISHLTPDEQAAHTSIPSMYMALEDCESLQPFGPASVRSCWLAGSWARKVVEKTTPPIFQIEPGSAADISRVHHFTGAADSTLIALGPRRSPYVVSPGANSDKSFSICTSNGFRQETVESYIAAGETIGPDIFIGAADIPGEATYSAKRREKMSHRTSNWTTQLLSGRRATGGGAETAPALFAPVLPLPVEQQRLYIDELAAEPPAGLALYDPDVAQSLPVVLSALPRLSLAVSLTPQAILGTISAGMDVVVLQLVNAATDAGIALDFKFPAPQPQSTSPVPLGRDMFDPEGELETSLEPLAPSCACYACTTHHSAYLRHLLHTKEMLGWTLLQVHNHAVTEAFFAGIQDALQQGIFEDQKDAFERYYVDRLPEVAGKGPRWETRGKRVVRGWSVFRIRGHHLKSEGPNEQKKNPPAYNRFQSSDTTTIGDREGMDKC